MKIQRIEEFLIDDKIHSHIRELLDHSFSGYPEERTYFKQLPHFRFLCWDQEKLIGHMAVDHRVINNNGQVHPIFGVIDLCVAEAYQHKKIASNLLENLEEIGTSNGIDFIVLMAKNHQLYKSKDFQLKKNICQWMVINSHQTYGVVRRRVEQSLMIKPLGDKYWDAGLVDFLGPAF